MGLNPLQDLDADQIKVAKHDKGLAMVIAGAGSGKTRALIQRIAYLVDQGTDPSRILATTFTRKATGEIQERLKGFGVPCETRNKGGVRVGTLHSTAYEILRGSTEYGRWEVNNAFAKSLIHDLIDELKTPFDGVAALQFVAQAKNHARAPHDDGMEYDSWFARGMYQLNGKTYIYVYKRFEEIRRERRLLTYDDMLLEAWRVLENDRKAREEWQERFDYVLVDEAQDTNLVQFYIVERLSDVHKNYMIIGDPFQSIYSWRGAHPMYMKDFPDRYPGAVVYTMGKNYRCARDILARANDVIGKSAAAGFSKLKLEAVRPVLGKAECRAQKDEKVQAAWLARQIRLRLNKGVQPRELAILYRTKRVGTLLATVMDHAAIPHKRLDGVPFFERVAVRALINCLTMVVHPYWIEAGCQALDAVKFVGPATLEKLRSAPGDDLLEKASWLAAGPRGVRIQKRQRENLDKFVEVIRSCEELPPVEALDRIIEGISFLRVFNMRKMATDEGAEDLIQDVHLLRERLGRFKTIEGLIAHTLKLAGEDSTATGNRVTLSTIHRIKGLEFSHVYIASAIEGVLPHKFATVSDSPEDLDEERRLFYVASTRAMNSLTVVVPRGRFDFKTRTVTPIKHSRFIEEAGLVVPE